MIRRVRFLALLLGCLLAGSAQAGSTLKLTLTVVFSSGPCAASVKGMAVSVSCGAFESLPVLPPTGELAGAQLPTVLAGRFGTYTPPFIATAPNAPQRPDDGSAEGSAQGVPFAADWTGADEQALRQVGLLPAWATGNSPMALYSGHANLSSWRVVSNDNPRRVELTISW